MIFDGYVNQLPDTDPGETQEWLDSLDAVIDVHGKTRARFLLSKLLERARAAQVSFPATVSTPYVNTIPREHEPWFPGDEYIERRIRALRPLERGDDGGAGQQARRRHRRPPVARSPARPASTRSASTTSSAARTTAPPATTSTSRATPRPASTPGRSSRVASTEDDLDHFRREIGRDGRGLSSYPHPRLMPDFWEFPTVSMGLGPITALYQARFNRYLQNRELDDTSQSRVWAFLGDGECDEPETLGALSLASREKLDNLVFVVNCNLQRLDGPVRGNGKIIQELEAVFRGAGWNVIKVILRLEVGRAARQRQGRRAAQPDEHHRRRRVPALQRRERRVHPRRLLRARPAPAPDGRPPQRRRPGQPAPRRPRLPQALRRLQGRHREPRLGRADGHPVQDDQGLDARARHRGPQRHAPDQEDDQGSAAASCATGCTCTTRSPTRRSTATCRRTSARRGLDRVPVHDGAPPGARRLDPQAHRRGRAGRWSCPTTARSPSCAPARATQAVSTTMGFTRLLRNLARDEHSSASTSCRSSPTRPARSAWTRCSAS